MVNNTVKYVAFLRGINVGGHHKVAMADLKKELQSLGFKNIETLLNSGNIIFEAKNTIAELLEETLASHLEKTFGFTIPTIIRTADVILKITEQNPFKNIELTKDLRFYASFLKNDTNATLQLPWSNENNSYKILSLQNKTILSVLDVSITKTPKAMEALEKSYGKGITTRNWNTILKIEKKLKA